MSKSFVRGTSASELLVQDPCVRALPAKEHDCMTVLDELVLARYAVDVSPFTITEVAKYSRVELTQVRVPEGARAHPTATGPKYSPTIMALFASHAPVASTAKSATDIKS
jgi:hypothetical protein